MSRDAILALVSGYAEPHRSEKPLAFLQAFTDDSASELGDRRLFFAGYLNNALKWSLFSEAWAEELRSAPAIAYLKMSEAARLQGEFRGWSEPQRDEKLQGLARVIRHFKPMSFEFSVSRQEYERDIKSLVPRGLGSPHFLCTVGVIAGLARYVESQKVKVPLDFIFDQQDGVSDDINLLFSDVKKSVPRKARELINGNPIFRDDKQVLPLQAADMLAWHIRREHELGGVSGNLPMADLLRGRGHLVSSMEAKDYAHWPRQLSKLPGIDKLQSKSQWRAAKKLAAAELALSPWQRFLSGARGRLLLMLRSK